ncbi:MAG: SGNH/GDSL hydrolase family protein [Gordonia sp. (in: high G+C Gram-positive bacteria)]
MRRPSSGRLATITTAVSSAVAVVVGGIVVANTNDGPASAVVNQAKAVPKPAPKLKYVAMGSSFAAGPGGNSPIVDRRCGRGADNYPRQVAKALNMDLIDVTCSGATTADVLRSPKKHPERAPQIDSVTPDTSLVTVTIGGNDVGYITRIASSSCLNIAIGLVIPPPGRMCTGVVTPSPFPMDTAYQKLEKSLSDIAVQVKARAPKARLVFVDYPMVASVNEMQCPNLPLEPWQVVETAMVGQQLADATARAARTHGAEVITLSNSAQHTACSLDPWVNGYTAHWPFHPNAQGKAAMAEQVIAALR